MNKSLLLIILTLIILNTTAQNTYVPDDNFENALIDIGYDDVLDDYVLTANISGITFLDLFNRYIEDLTGIEDFESLEVLKCGYNQLTNLDVSSNIALAELYCYHNQLTDIDVTNNTALNYLTCESNQLTSLDVSNNLNLTELNCGINQLTNLNVLNNEELIYLGFYDNPITSINASNNTNLQYLICPGNLLTGLDVSNNPELYVLNCNNNQLSYIDLRNGNNDGLWQFYSENNPDLKCIYVDDKDLVHSDWYIDPWTTFVETEAECDALGIYIITEETGISIYPNPTSNQIFFDFSESNIQKISIMNIAGKTIFEKIYFNKNQQIDLSDHQSGIYIINIQTDKKVLTSKIIKR